MTRIDNWFASASHDGQVYLAPEQYQVRICGNVYNHPKQPDGKFVMTGHVQSAKGRTFTTNRTTYKFGVMDKHYRKWLKKTCPDWDWKNPITIKED